jgi:hypothetical protein
MSRKSRTTHLAYENVEGYPRPASLPPLSELESYIQEYADQARISRRAARFLFRLSGFDRRLEQLQRDPLLYETALRDVPARFMISNAIMFSATAVLRDEEESPAPLDRAARLVAAARSFYLDLLAARIPPDAFRGAPLEMGQYRNLFSTCNYPSGACMNIYKSPEDSYIVAAANGCYFKLPLPLVEGRVDLPSLHAGLETVVAEAHKEAADASPGALSAAAPIQRVVGFSLLRFRPQNRAALEILANAFLVLCLDLQSSPADEEEACRLAQSGNLDNRWYLASNQIVVYANAKASIVFSYICGIDGNVMTRFTADIRRRALQLATSDATKGNAPATRPERMRFSIPAWLARWAHASCRGMLADERALFRIRDWGGESLLRRGLRLDSVFNIAMMMAAEKIAGRPPVYVELLTMAKYRYRGLGDSLPWSPAVSRLADPAFDAERGEEAAETLRQALEAHRQALRRDRERFNLSDLLSLHLALSAPWRWPLIVFTLMKLMSSIDVIVSFPQPSEDIDVVGRIGVRLFARLFCMHYETSAESISVAFMPSQGRSVPNREVFAAFEESLRKIVRIAGLLPEAESQPRIRLEEVDASRMTEKSTDAVPS